jgi:hypothetical protein
MATSQTASYFDKTIRFGGADVGISRQKAQSLLQGTSMPLAPTVPIANQGNCLSHYEFSQAGGLGRKEPGKMRIVMPQISNMPNITIQERSSLSQDNSDFGGPILQVDALALEASLQVPGRLRAHNIDLERYPYHDSLPSGGPFTFSSSIPVPNTPTSSPSSSQFPSIIQIALSTPPIQRFAYLYAQTAHLIQFQGPYLVNDSGHLICFARPRPTLSATRVAASLAAAQDSLATLQPEGPIFEDLRIFSMLWETTCLLLETMLDSNAPPLEYFGWAVYGLASGYIDPGSIFLLHKQRLHAALMSLPSLNKAQEKILGGEAVFRTSTGKIHTVVTANRSVHICAVMLVQTMKRDWGRVRWFHVISICERWLRHVGWLSDDSVVRTIKTGKEGQSATEDDVMERMDGLHLGKGEAMFQGKIAGRLENKRSMSI